MVGSSLIDCSYMAAVFITLGFVPNVECLISTQSISNIIKAGLFSCVRSVNWVSNMTVH